MKISDLIEQLELIKRLEGNLVVVMACDAEGNRFSHLDEATIEEDDRSRRGCVTLWPL